MAKAVGSSKTGGRKKGTPNKRTLAFKETLEERGIDLLGEVLDTAKRLPERERANLYLNLLPYQYPKRKPTETSPTSLADHLNQMNNDQLRELYQDLGRRLGMHKTYDKMNKEEREKHDEVIDSLKRMIRAEEELGVGPD